MQLVKNLLLISVFFFSSNVMPAEPNFDTDIRYLHVQKGQTLHNIVKRLYPHRVKDWPELSQAIVKHNPQAFINGDATRMIAGARIELPQKMIIRAVPATTAKSQKVGFVIESEGNVVAVDSRKVSRKLSGGAAVYLGDKVITGEKGYVRLKMIDDAVLDLRCYSIMVIEEYAIDTKNRRSILNLLKGSLRQVTGEIGKLTEDIYELRTPVANVGVRGTEYALRVFQSKGCGGTLDADDGMYLEVIKGLVDVHNSAGHELLSKGETAYVPLPKTAPQKVAPKPGILTPVKVEPVMAPVPAQPVEEESSSGWWWLLGVVAIVLLI